MAPSTPVQVLITLLPILITAIFLMIITVPISLRKGRNPVLWGLLCCVPFANLFLALWLISQTDVEVKDQIRALQDDLAKMRSSLDNKTN